MLIARSVLIMVNEQDTMLSKRERKRARVAVRDFQARAFQTASAFRTILRCFSHTNGALEKLIVRLIFWRYPPEIIGD